jgi:prepilin-type N-terminal cleavage/methylation domain-containing protein
MIRRSGMTLMEVLVAIGVMAVAILPAMGLFLIGLVTMAKAIEDDRVGHCAGNAKAMAAAQGLRFDPMVTPFFINPNGNLPPAQRTLPDAALDGPSYPVFVDPIGYLSISPQFRDYVGTRNNWLRRRPAGFATNTASALRWCTFQDDITFGPDGQPVKPNGFIERGSNYSWAWMLRRPKMGMPAVCDVWVVVYKQRALNLNGTAPPELLYINCEVNPQNANLLTLVSYPGQPSPQVQPGSWVLDISLNFPSIRPIVTAPPTGNFYRVVGVGDTTPSTQNPGYSLQPVELANPVLGPIYETRAMAIMDGVAEVIYCGPGWSPGSN